MGVYILNLSSTFWRTEPLLCSPEQQFLLCFPLSLVSLPQLSRGISVKELESGIELNPGPGDLTLVMDIHRLSIPW